MKLFKNFAIVFFVIVIFNSCTEEESFKDLNDQLVVYPITFDDNNIADRMEPVFNESDTAVLTMRIAIHPPQPYPVEVTYEIRKPTDLDENTNAARDTLDYTLLQDTLMVTIPANRDYVDVDVLQIVDDTDPESPEDFIFYVTDASIFNVLNPPDIKLLEGSRQYRFNIRQSDDDIEFVDDEIFLLEGEEVFLQIDLEDTLRERGSILRFVYETNATQGLGADYVITPVDTFTAVSVGEDSLRIPFTTFPDTEVEYPEFFNITLARIENENGFLNLDESASITIYDNSTNPAAGELAVTLTWDDLENVDLSLTLWEDTGLDTVQISSVNVPSSFETLILDQTLFTGSYLITASWEGSSNDVTNANISSYVARNGPVQDIDDVNSATISEGETVFLYKIDKSGSTFTVNDL